ncbi:MAG: UDP-N-acetylglucosamine 2-epimerase (non-hydrolyzing) [Acidobacteriota bacterium]
MKVLSVVGARPQFVKAAFVARAVRTAGREVLLHTGQHYDDELSDRFFRDLDLPAPDYQLGVGSATHAAQTAQMLTGIEGVILREKPDVTVVYGDTNSTIAGALAAAKLHVPVAHVEAGLRSFDRSMPEEVNRIVTDHLSTLLFCCSRHGADVLAAEGIRAGVHVVGDVMFESLNAASRHAARSRILADLGVHRGEFLLATIHRAGNTDDPARLGALLSALVATGETVVFPIHPRTRRAIEQAGLWPEGRVRLIPPVGYHDMIALEQAARLILTDSGGVQKEAYWLGVPCVTLRDETEWIETVDAGWNRLAGADPERILDAIRTFNPPAKRPPLYVEGQASQRIATLLTSSPC